MKRVPVITAPTDATPPVEELLKINEPLVTEWLVEFLRDEVIRRRGFRRVVFGLSGGVDSATVAFLCARAFGPENVWGLRLPYRTSSPESLAHAQMVVEATGIHCETIDISPAVDGYIENYEPDADPKRRGNVMARMRMIVWFDKAAKYNALPIGTGNKTERLFGYFTWHGDDSPPINPIGDLFKTQVWMLARYLGVPDPIIHKPPSADLVRGQTDEGDLGIPYRRADHILYYLLLGYRPERLVGMGFGKGEVQLVKQYLDRTHWKRRPPTTAMLSQTSIGDYYLRPVDY